MDDIARVLAILASICTITGVSIWSVVSYFNNKNDEIIIEFSTDENLSENVIQESENSLSVEAVEYSSITDIYSNDNIIEKINVEEEVKQIKKEYYKVQNQKDSSKQHPINKKIEIFYLADKIVSIEVSSGYNDIKYSRIYYYDENGKLYFAFVFDKKKENRLYFKDDILIRYIDENGETYNLYENLNTCIWSELVLNESYELLQSVN